MTASAASEAVPPPVPSAAWTRRARRAALGGAAAAGVAAIGILAAGWYFSTELERQGLRIDHSPDAFDLVAAPAGDGVVRLSEGPADGGWTTDGTYGLAQDGGYGQVTGIRARGEGWVERDFRPMEGTLTAATQRASMASPSPRTRRTPTGTPSRRSLSRANWGRCPRGSYPAAPARAGSSSCTARTRTAARPCAACAPSTTRE
ncbi:MAG: hypothetical protein U0547_00090 [Dehalococcoidia bacterium]